MQDSEFTPPKKSNKAFVSFWTKFIEDVRHRDNLKPTHLHHLSILCDLCVEYDELLDSLDLEGRTYESVGRNGRQIKMRPEVDHLKKVTSEIRNYSKMLKLTLMDDKKLNSEEEANDFAS